MTICAMGENLGQTPAVADWMKKSLAAIQKSLRSIVSFARCDWQQKANQLTLSTASTLLLTHLLQSYSDVQW